ncbi:hypothetical protein [Paenibacillus sp. FSL H3-0333]|uniref:hypothetical protein n=1 Tax=Paenibacillus sp. FSL H3-0333 TaxID=2921373 RepID=UPI0030F5E662
MWSKFYLVFLALVMYFGYPLGIPDRPSASSAQAEAPAGDSQTDSLSVALNLPLQAKVNEEFTMKASLSNDSLSDVNLMSRAQLFTYVIKDANGKQINSYAVEDKGVASVLSGKSKMSEAYTYKIKKCGTYSISADAEFTITDNGAHTQMKLSTAAKTLVVK